MIYAAKDFTLRNGLKVTLKSPDISDAEGLLDQIIETAKATNYLLSDPEDFLPFKQNLKKEEEFISTFNDGEDCLICVYHDQRIIGSCKLSLRNHQKDSHRAEIGISIIKEYWGMGIGSLLFDEVINIARSIPKIEQLELDVIKDNERAKKLYTKKGFVKVGDIPHQLKLKDGTYLDGEMMVLYL